MNNVIKKIEDLKDNVILGIMSTTTYYKMKEMNINISDLRNVLESLFKLKEPEQIFMLNDKMCNDAINNIIGYRVWLKQLNKKNNILTDKEKSYLKAVIKPFKKDIKYIRKVESLDKYIEIAFNNNDFMCFPNLNNKDYYKNMEFNTEYTLEDLDLL